MDDFRLSVIIPIYNEQSSIRPFLGRLVPLLEAAAPDYEVVCVNDGSTDQTLALLVAGWKTNPRFRIIDLSRNFGKEVAVTAGIDFATGDAVIPLDADLQDPPELIPEMVAKWREGYDMVIAVRGDRRGDPIARRGMTDLFYRLASSLSDVPIPPHAGDFRLMDRRVVEALKRMPEHTRFLKGMFAWLGFRQAVIMYDRPARIAGSSKWRFWTLWNFALEGLFSFTTLPLRIWSYLGLLLALASSVYIFVVIAHTLINGVEVPGYVSIVVLVLFFSGLNMVGIGILGEYIGRIFIEVKRRPLYVVRETIGFTAGNPQSASRSNRPCKDQDVSHYTSSR